jgi:hypothetical protein
MWLGPHLKTTQRAWMWTVVVVVVGEGAAVAEAVVEVVEVVTEDRRPHLGASGG